jgi:hypothetical protein
LTGTKPLFHRRPGAEREHLVQLADLLVGRHLLQKAIDSCLNRSIVGRRRSGLLRLETTRGS